MAIERPLAGDSPFERSQQAAIALRRATRGLPVVTVESAEQGVAPHVHVSTAD